MAKNWHLKMGPDLCYLLLRAETEKIRSMRDEWQSGNRQVCQSQIFGCEMAFSTTFAITKCVRSFKKKKKATTKKHREMRKIIRIAVK